MSLICDSVCQLILINYWHAELQFSAKTKTMLVFVDGPPGVHQIDVAAGTVIHYETPAVLHGHKRQALRTVDYL